MSTLGGERITDPSRLAELREMNNYTGQPGRCKHCGSSSRAQGLCCIVCGAPSESMSEITDDTACTSCGARLGDNGGPAMISTQPGIVICAECARSAQGKMQRAHVYAAIDGERDYQDKKHGHDKHTPMEWLAIIEFLVVTAKSHFFNQEAHKISDDVRKIAGTAVACMEQCGVTYRIGYAPQHTTVIMQSDLRKEVEGTLNRFSAENGSNTPDFILAQYLMDCLGAYDKAVTAREKWYGREPKPLDPQPLPPPEDVSVTRARMAGAGIGEVYPPPVNKAQYSPHYYEHPDVETTATDKPCRICGQDLAANVHSVASIKAATGFEFKKPDDALGKKVEEQFIAQVRENGARKISLHRHHDDTVPARDYVSIWFEAENGDGIVRKEFATADEARAWCFKHFKDLRLYEKTPPMGWITTDPSGERCTNP